MHTTRSFATLSSILETHGAQAAIEYLNAGVAHRFTAVYRLDDGILRNVLLCDKLGEIRPEYLAEIPLAASFCQFVLRDGVFKTTNTATDHRVDGHPYQGVLICYHGVPVLNTNGELWGTLCHFDVLELTLSDAEFELQQQAAQQLPPYLPQV